MFRRGGGTKRPRFTVGGHSIFENDDSSNHSGAGMTDYDDDSLSQHHTTSNNSTDQHFALGHYIPERVRRVQRPPTKPVPHDNTNLNACLDHLLRIVSRKDKEGFFQYPVTDQFAPGYSQIITRPMDFSTMKRKITQDEYSNVLEFRSDFELMCENAMKYNRPETIYWQAAKKLLNIGTKLMNKEKLLSSRRSVECFSRLTERELGFRIDLPSTHNLDESSSQLNESLDSSIIDSDNLSSISVSQACSQRKPKLILKLPKFYDKPAPVIVEPEEVEEPEEEEPEEEFSPEEILAQARQASKCARDKFNSRHPMTSYTLSYQRGNGTSSLRLINQDDSTEQSIALVEPSYLSSNDDGSSARDFLEHGPFSLQPTHNDSSFTSMSKEELDLLIHTYGSEFSAQYAASLMDYVKNTGDLALAYVDRFLSVLTNGEHDNFVAKKREKEPIKEEIVEKTDEPASSSSTALAEESLTISSAFSVKLEPDQDDQSKTLIQTSQTPFDQLADDEPETMAVPIKTELVVDYDFADLTDLSHLSNGPQHLISSDTMDSNETPFDSF